MTITKNMGNTLKIFISNFECDSYGFCYYLGWNKDGIIGIEIQSNEDVNRTYFESGFDHLNEFSEMLFREFGYETKIDIFFNEKVISVNVLKPIFEEFDVSYCSIEDYTILKSDNFKKLENDLKLLENFDPKKINKGLMKWFPLLVNEKETIPYFFRERNLIPNFVYKYKIEILFDDLG